MWTGTVTLEITANLAFSNYTLSPTRLEQPSGKSANNVETFSWAFSYNVQDRVNRGPGSFGEPDWIGIYDMHAAGLLLRHNATPGTHGILKAASNWILDATMTQNTSSGGTGTPATLHTAGADYQAIHTDAVLGNRPTVADPDDPTLDARTLFWRWQETNYAVRRGPWKLVDSETGRDASLFTEEIYFDYGLVGKRSLFNLDDSVSETAPNDRIAAEPGLADEL